VERALSSLGMKTAGGRVLGAAARAFTPLESIERSAFYRLTLERLRSAVIKASARPELENSQDPKRIRADSGFLQRNLIIAPHSVGPKSLL
jgi:hypothetical protein